MKAFNGVRIYKMGDVDCIFAPDEDQAFGEFSQLVGIETAIEIAEEDNITEYTDEEFKNGKVHYDLVGDKDEYDAPLIPHREALADLTKDGRTVGHYSTSEW